jgi:hypothetical protein
MGCIVLVATTVFAPHAPRAAQGGQPPDSMQRAAQGTQPTPPQMQRPEAPRPYKVVDIKLPVGINDPTLDAFRKELQAIAERKDRAALGRTIVARGFFWENEQGDLIDKSKSGLQALAKAVDLDAKDGSGWDVLVGLITGGLAGPDPDRKNVICAPALPELNEQEFDALLQSTKTDPSDWAYPASPSGLEVHAAAQASSPVVEKLGLHLVRIMPDDTQSTDSADEDWVRVATPSAKTGYASGSALASLGSDQLCYVKEGAAWKIAGIYGGGQ